MERETVEIKGIKFAKSSFTRRRRCVGVSIQKDKVLVTNTTKKQAIVEFTHDEWRAFVKGVKNHEFDIED